MTEAGADAGANGGTAAPEPANGSLEAIERFVAEQLAQAGARALAALRSMPRVEFKDEKRTDPVTEADRQVEALLSEAIRRAYPAHGILGEEGSAESLEAEHLWVIDPIDGTANFSNGLPLFAISLALLRGGAPIVGGLWMPLGPGGGQGVLHARRGGGAWFGGQPVRVTAAGSAAPRLAALPGSWRGAFTLKPSRTPPMADARGLGSICLESGLVACGGFRWSIFLGPKLWDVAATTLLVREAGGLVRVWQDHAWRDLERFSAPSARRDGKPPTLRDWSRPTLMGDPESVAIVTERLDWRRPPHPVVRRALKIWRGLRAPSKPRSGSRGRREI